MGLRLSARDPQILKAVNDCQALTVAQLQTLFWNSANPAYTRLRKLADYGYVKPFYITQVKTGPAASQMVYTIDRKGAAILAEAFGYTRDDIRYAGRQVRNWQSLRSILSVNDVRVALTRACWEQADYHMESWQEEYRFRANPDYVYVKRHRKPVYPDAFCVISRGRVTTHNFVEVDSGTEGLQQFKSQIEIYQVYVASGLYQQTFGTEAWRVLVVTTSEKRRDNLRKKTLEARGGANYWFTTFDQLSVDTVLDAPIWVQARGDQPVMFIPKVD